MRITAPEGERGLVLNSSRFERLKEGGVGDTVLTVASILELLEKADIGCFVDGKFVSNPAFKPNC
jgi:hypothetical protein